MMDAKKTIRSALREKRKAISSEERIQSEQLLKQHLSSFFEKNCKIAAYLACGSEANLLPWMQSAQDEGSRVFVPFIEKDCRRLWFTEYEKEGNELHSEPFFGIPQFEGKKYRAEELDVILLPLVGIDQQGFRMGQGGGYYDTTLEYCVDQPNRPKLIGVGFSCQMVDSLPVDPWDMQLDGFISELGLKQFTRA